MDTPTCLGKIHEATDSIASAWLARPPVGHRQRSMWEEGCREEVRKLKELIRHVKEPVSVPPLVLAFLVEHNRAVSAKQRDYNYEAFNPDSTISKVGQLFTRDEKYKIHIKKAGWWTDLGAVRAETTSQVFADPKAANRTNEEASSAGGTGANTSDPLKSVPTKRDARSAAVRGEAESSRNTRARTRAQTRPVAAQPDLERPAPRNAPLKLAPPHASARPTQTKTPFTAEVTPTPSRDISESPVPVQVDHEVWDPASKEIRDEWLISNVAQLNPCKKCRAAGHTCRVNLVHGVACNRCTNSSVGCSLAAKQPEGGPNWSYDQRRWILVHWARHAKGNTPYPSEVAPKFPVNFAPPGWFVEGLQAARGKDNEAPKKRGKRARAEESPAGQTRRAVTAPATDSEDDIPSVKYATPVKRRRSRRAKSTTIKEDTEDDSEAEKADESGDSRPNKRPRTDSRASTAVPQPSRPWKHLRNVEHLLRNSPGSLQPPVPRRDGTDAWSAAAGAYAPDFDRNLLELTMMPQPHAVSSLAVGSVSPLHGSASPFHSISPSSAGTQLVEMINANNQSFDARLAAVWEALGRQMVAYDTFKEDTRRELQDLKRALSAPHLDPSSATHEHDVLRHDGQAQEAEIERLRSEVLALKARLGAVRSSSPTPPFPAPMAPAADNLAGPPTELPAELPTELPAKPPTELSAAPPTELPAAPPTEPPAESLAELPADSLAEELADSLGEQLDDSLGEPLADVLGDALAEFMGELPAEARDQRPRDQRPEQTQDQPANARLETLDPPRHEQVVNTQADGEQKEGLSSALDGSSGRSPTHDPFGEAGSPRMPTTLPSPSPPPGVSAGMQALSQYESSSGSARSTGSSRSASPEPVLGSNLGDGLSPSGQSGVRTAGSVEGPEA